MLFMSSSQDEYSSATHQSETMGGDPLSRLHRHIIRFSIIDNVLLLMLIMTGFGGSGGTVLLFVILAALLIVPLSVISIVMLQRKSSGGLNVGIANLSLTGSLFLLIGVLGLYSYVFESYGNILLLVALTLLGVSTLRRVKTMRNDAYASWYDSHTISTSNPGDDSEVLSTCPGCDSILAVIPSKLSSEDVCPNCGCKLVSS